MTVSSNHQQGNNPCGKCAAGEDKNLKDFHSNITEKEINSKTRNKGRDRGVKDNKAPGTRIGAILFNVNVNFAQRETCKNVIHNTHYHKFSSSVHQGIKAKRAWR